MGNMQPSTCRCRDAASRLLLRRRWLRRLRLLLGLRRRRRLLLLLHDGQPVSATGEQASAHVRCGNRMSGRQKWRLRWRCEALDEGVPSNDGTDLPKEGSDELGGGGKERAKRSGGQRDRWRLGSEDSEGMDG